MKVGIIVYSQSGNTLLVAQRLKKAFEEKGHTVSLEKVEASGEGANPKLIFAPDVSPYDLIVFASPVHAFSLAPAMKLYLSQLQDLKGKIVYSFVTQQLKKDWMGGNHAIKQMKSACREKGAEVIMDSIVHWSSNEREGQIEALTKKLSAGK